MNRPGLQELLRRFTRDDPLGLGAVEWRARCLEERRFSSIWVLVPATGAAALHARTGGADLVLKLYHQAQPQRRQREYDDLVRVHTTLGPAAGVVRPVACYADRGALITARAPGVPLAPLLRAACGRGRDRDALGRAAALCTGAGAWLRDFQAYGSAVMRGRHSEHLANPESFLSYVDERLRILRRSRPAIEPSLQTRILAHAAAKLHALPARTLERVTWSHSDFGPHNVLVDGDRLCVLDFELAPQHPYFDVAYFVEALANAAGPRVDSSRVLRLQRAFLAGYAAEIDAPLLHLFRLRHLVCSYVSETRRGGFAQLRTWPGLLDLRARLRRMPAELARQVGSRAA